MPDIIIIGGGPGGSAAATRAAQLGAQVTLVERAELGGNCVNRNCIPLTSLLASVELYRKICRAGEMGIKVGPATLDVPAMTARAQGIASELSEGMGGLLPTFGIEIAAGTARLVDSHTVEVDGQRLTARKAIILATGVAWAPAPTGIAGILRPDEAIKLDPVPGKVVVWGSGPAEVDFATLYAGLGAQVTMVTEGAYPLPEEDYEIGQRLQGILQSEGVELLTNSKVQSATAGPDGLDVVVAGRKGESHIKADRVFWTGRAPATQSLGLAEVGVKVDTAGFITVDEHQQTSVPGIYAVGDVTGGPFYSSLATAGGLVAAENAMGTPRKLDRRAVPRYSFAIPEVGCVGLTEDQATDAGYEIEVANIAYNTNSRAMGLGEVDGGIKLIADQKLGKVLGVHIVGHRATELVAEAALGLQLEALADDWAWAIRVHPTLSESMLEAGRAIRGQALYVPKF